MHVYLAPYYAGPVTFIQPGGDFMSMPTGQKFENSTVNGPAINNVEGFIGSINNIVNNSPVSDEVKQAVRQVVREAEALMLQMGDGRADKRDLIRRRLDTFSQEAVAKEPDKPMLKMSGESLIAAATTVAGVAKPVKEAVEAVLALLGVK
jgi:hypothetical protein